MFKKVHIFIILNVNIACFFYKYKAVALEEKAPNEICNEQMEMI